VKLTDTEKTAETFARIREINDLCFTKIDTPPYFELLREFEQDDVFVQRYDIMKGIGFGEIVSYITVNTQSPIVYIWQVATHPSNRGHGHATDLLKEIVEYYKNTKTAVELSVNVDNAVAQILYLKNGFRVVRVLHDYFGPEINGLLMRRVYEN
jgi:ribosomal protein S18 acetylase RimI-like enzyme